MCWCVNVWASFLYFNEAKNWSSYSSRMYYCLLLPVFGDFSEEIRLRIGSISKHSNFNLQCFSSAQCTANATTTTPRSAAATQLTQKKLLCRKIVMYAAVQHYVCGLNESMQNFCLFVQKQKRTEATVRMVDLFFGNQRRITVSKCDKTNAW